MISAEELYFKDREIIMRVIAGTARRLELKTPSGLDTRPTTDRIKETLFNILYGQYEGGVFLDLFAGSGGIGIEALSRGASKAVFVENGREALSCIRSNLEHTRLGASAEVLGMDAVRAINFLDGRPPFRVIFMDPPYDHGLERQVLEALSRTTLADAETLIIVEALLSTDFGYLDSIGYECVREKVYKTNKHVFIRRKED